MAPQTTRPADEDPRGTVTRTLRLRRLLSPVVAVSGVGLLVAAARSASEDRRRAAALGVAGGGLLAGWVRRQGPPTANDPEAPEVTGERTGDGEVSDEAAAHLEQSKVLNQDETNPRGTSGEPDVETETDPDEGDVRFSTGGDEGTEPKPDLDGDAADDPRVPDGEAPETDDDHVEVDLSEAAMADEASEATGPNPEQAYPSREGTDPEPTSPEAPESDGEGAATNPGPMSDDGDETGDEEAGHESPEVVDDDDDASDVVEADDDVPAPDVDETDDRM